MRTAAALAMLLALLLGGCAADFADIAAAPELTDVGEGLGAAAQSGSAASLASLSEQQEGWEGGNADYFRDARARQPGDLITVRIAIDDRASLSNTSNRSRRANAGADLGLSYSLMGTTEAEIAGEGSVNSTSSAMGQGLTARSERITLAVAAIVTDVLPNGHLLIEGSQEVLVNAEKRRLKVAGIVHPADITPDNAISYEKIAEARIAYGGEGQITAVQRPGWAQRAWDAVAPF